MAQIEHVVVLMLENRSFDHMLGFLDHPDPAFDGLLKGGPYTQPGWGGGPAVEATALAKLVLPVDPDHSHDAVLEQLADGFVTAYERKCRGLAKPRFGGLLGPVIEWFLARVQARDTPILGRGPLIMLCQPPANLPVMSRLALEFGVCTRWFCSVPGETWPNRNYVHAATSDGETNIQPRFYTNPTIFELLERAGRSWRIYHHDTPQVWAFSNLWEPEERLANWFHFARFAEHVAAGDLPAYSFIEPSHTSLVQVPEAMSNSQHPGNNVVPDALYDDFEPDGSLDFDRAERLIATIYESLRTRPDVFDRTLLLITYDEHGGLYDHVPPPAGMADPGEKPDPFARLFRLLYHKMSKTFDFTTLGPRVPAIVISPYVPAGTVDAEVREHAGVPATLRALFAPAEAPLTVRDAAAARFDTLLTLDQPRRDLPDLSSALVLPPPEVVPPDAGERMPEHYDDLVALADRVRRKLHVPADAPERERAHETSDAFIRRAEQARSEP